MAQPAAAGSYPLGPCAAPRSLAITFGGSGRQIELSDKRPDEITDLPALQTDKPLFGAFAYGKGENRLIAPLVLDDASPPVGVYDVLYIDTNFDGRLADETALSLPAMPDTLESFVAADGEQPLAEVTLTHARLPGGTMAATVEYANLGSFSDVRGSDGGGADAPSMHYLSVSPGARRATARFGDRELMVVVTDEDGDGDFGDTSAGSQEFGMFAMATKDVVYVDLNGNGLLGEDDSEPTADAEHLAASMLSMGGACYEIATSADASELQVSPVEGATGWLTAPPCEAYVDVRAKDGARAPISIVAEPGESVALPVGSYELLVAIFRSQATDGTPVLATVQAPAQYGLAAQDESEEPAPALEITADAVATLSIGPPIAATVETQVERDDGGRTAEMELKLVDAAGLAVRLEIPGEEPAKGIGLEVVGPDGAVVYTGAFEYG